jgi:hypothetical protein
VFVLLCGGVWLFLVLSFWPLLRLFVRVLVLLLAPLAAFLLRAGLLCFSWFFMLFCYVLLPFVGCFLY